MAFRFFACALVGLFTLCAASAETAAQTVKLQGVVRSAKGTPVPFANVDIYDGRTRLVRGEPVSLSGTFSISLRDFAGSHLTCVVSARGYETRRVTAPVAADRTASFGDITLDPHLTLVPGPVTAAARMHGNGIKYEPDGTQIDVFFHNANEQPLEITKVRLHGTARRATDCLDYTPTIEIKIHTTFAATISELTATDSGKREGPLQAVDTVGTDGIVEMLPCKQGHVNISIPAHFTLKGGAEKHLRFVVPARLPTTTGESKLVDLSQWSTLVVTFTLADGSTVDATR